MGNTQTCKFSNGGYVYRIEKSTYGPYQKTGSTTYTGKLVSNTTDNTLRVQTLDKNDWTGATNPGWTGPFATKKDLTDAKWKFDTKC